MSGDILLPKMTLRDAAWLVCLVASAVGLYFHTDYKSSRLSEHVERNQVQLEKLEIIVSRMDRDGTSAARDGRYTESETSRMNERRLAQLESQWSTASPKIERIDVNIQWLMKNQGGNPQK